MILRTCAGFVADFPDHAVWDDKEELVLPGGRATTEAIREMIGRIGLTPEAAESDLGHHAWTFWAKGADLNIGIQVTDIGDKAWLHTEVDGQLFAGRRRKAARRQAYADILSALSEAMAQDARFRKVRWFTPDELDVPFDGAASPTSGEPGPPAPEWQPRDPGRSEADQIWPPTPNSLTGRLLARLKPRKARSQTSAP
jgi:hypothetical protein